jgi:hypothetical protein
MNVNTELPYPAEKVWDVVSDFGNLGRWNPAILTCTMDGSGVGAVRTFTSAAATVREGILALDKTGMRIKYSIISGSSIKVRDGELEISVQPLGPDKSRIQWTLDGEPDGMSAAELTALTTKRYLGRFEDLRKTLAAEAAA